MLRAQGVKHVFHGRPPETPEQFAHRFESICRGSAQNLAVARRLPTYYTELTTAERELDGERSLISCLRKLWSADEEDIDFEHIREHLKDRFMIVATEGSASANDNFDLAAVRRRITDSFDGAGQKPEDGKPFTPVELLRALEYGVELEVPNLTFGYVALHRQFWRLLDRIAKEMDDMLMDRESGWLGKERDLGCKVVPAIFWADLYELVEMEKEGIVTAGNPSALRFLKQAGRITEDFLQVLERETQGLRLDDVALALLGVSADPNEQRDQEHSLMRLKSEEKN